MQEKFKNFFVTDGTVTVDIKAENAREAAQEYVHLGDWEPSDSTTWFSIEVWEHEDEDGDPIDSKTFSISLDPPEPDCKPDKKHEWASPYSVLGGLEENPGVQGSGGGVVITEVCAHCGCYRIRDTWATNPETGEQGFESVEYDDADEQSLTWIGKRIFQRMLHDLSDVQEPYITDDNGVIRLIFSIHTKYDENNNDTEGEDALDEINAVLTKYGLEADWTGSANGMEEDAGVTFTYLDLVENGEPEEPGSEIEMGPSGPRM
jgi:hypothetical protein